MSYPDVCLSRMLTDIMYHKLSRWARLKLKLRRWLSNLKYRLIPRRWRRKYAMIGTVGRGKSVMAAALMEAAKRKQEERV